MKPLVLGIGIAFIFIVTTFFLMFSIDTQTGQVIKEIQESKAIEIRVTETGFYPPKIYIKEGNTITFTNTISSPQIIVGENWKSEMLFQNDNFTITFLEKGEQNYYSMLNENFTGKIIILD